MIDSTYSAVIFRTFAVQSEQQTFLTFVDSGLMPPRQHGRSVDRGREPLIWTIGRPLRFPESFDGPDSEDRPASRQLARRHPANRQWEAVKPPVDVPARATLAELRPGNPSSEGESSTPKGGDVSPMAETTAGRVRDTSIWTLQNSRGQGPMLNITSDREKLCRALNLRGQAICI